MLKPSLNLNFADTKRLDGRIEYSRTGVASHVGSDGLVKFVPLNVPRFDHDPTTRESLGFLIEKGSTSYAINNCNLDAFTDNFSATRYKCESLAPDGSYNAGMFFDTSLTNDVHYVQKTVDASVSPQATVSVSIYLKHISGDKNCSIAIGNTALFENSIWVTIGQSGYLASGVTNSGSILSYEVVSVGGGWFKVSMTGIPDLNGSTCLARCHLTSNTQSASAYLGTGTNGWAYWGLQIELSGFPTSLVPSTETFTSRASTATYWGSDGLLKSAAVNSARTNYNPKNLSLDATLLLEKSSTNLSTYSQGIGGTGWNTNGAPVITLNAATGPTGDTVATLIESTTFGSGTFGGELSLTSNTTYTWSVFVKSAPTASGYILQLGISHYAFGGTGGDRWLLFNLQTGAFTSVNPVFFKTTAQDVGNGWWRVDMTFTTTTVTDTSSSVIYGNADGVDFYAWGNQVEAGYTATSFIPTVTTAVTRDADIWSSALGVRGADIAFMPTISDWYKVDDGVFVFDVHKKYNLWESSYFAMLADTKSLSADERIQMNHVATGYPAMALVTGGDVVIASTQFGSLSPLKGELNKIAYKIKHWQFNAVTNGIVGTANTRWAQPLVSMMSIGGNITGTDTFFNGCIRQITYYPMTVTNADLERIT